MNKLVLSICGFLVLVMGGFGIAKLNQANGLEAERAALAAKAAQLEKDAKDAAAALKAANEDLLLTKANNQRLQNERDAAKQKLKEMESGAAPGGAEGTEVADSGGGRKDFRSMLQGYAKQMDDPEVRNMMKRGQERAVSRAYDRLFAQLNLSESDSKLLGEIIADRNVAAMDKGRKLLDGNADEATIAAVKKDIEATKAEYDAKIKAVVGDDKYNEFSNHEQTMGDRRAMDFAARNFERKNAPLQPQQREALNAIMKEERLKNPSNMIPDLGGGPGMSMLLSPAEQTEQSNREAKFQRSVLDRAPAAGLTPDQVVILQDSLKQRDEWRRMGNRMGRSFLGGGGGRQ